MHTYCGDYGAEMHFVFDISYPLPLVTIKYHFVILSVEILPSLENDANMSKPVMKFSESLNIESGFTRMTSEIKSILEFQQFPKLREACVQRINSLRSNLRRSIIPKIQRTVILDDMLDVFASSPYRNWFDTRLLQALVSASGSPEAEEWLESFKATFYAKKITEVIPYISIKPFKGSIDIVEKFDRNPKDLTISELLEHKYKLEYKVLDIDEGELVLSCIKTGCVELTWQIPQELVYRAYTSIKRKYDKLSSLAIKSLVCEEADEFAGLPILWRGQEVGEVGPIEPLPEHVRQEPYSLRQGFQWVTVSSNNVEEVAKFVNECHAEIFRITCEQKYDMNMINYFLTYPNARSDWQFGIQATGGKLVGIILAVPQHICIKKQTKLFLEVMIKCHKKYKNNRLRYILIKELMRRANLTKINQIILHDAPLFKPVSTVMYWKFRFNQHASTQLPSSPRTPDWRRMTLEDVPSALALINKWSSQFEIRQVFNTEEISHIIVFLQKHVFTYVVEGNSNEITDLVSYSLFYAPHTHAIINTVVSTQSPVKQLIIDALVCARGCGASEAFIYQYNIESDILTSISFQPGQSYTIHFCNYRYPEIS